MLELASPRDAVHEARAFAFDERDFRRIVRMIRAHAGIHLGDHKRDMVYSRLSRRVRTLGLQRFSDYLDLVEEGEAIVVERPKPLVPADFLQRLLPAVAWEIDAEHAGVEAATCAANAGGLPAARLDPLPDFHVIGRRAGDRTDTPAPASSAGAAAAASPSAGRTASAI